MSQYSKAIAVFLTGALTWGRTVVASKPGGVTAGEWLALATVAVTTLLVYVIRNDPAPEAEDPPPSMPVSPIQWSYTPSVPASTVTSQPPAEGIA